MATDGIFVDEGGGVVRMNPAAVSLAHYSIRVGKGATTPLQVLASIAREYGIRKSGILFGRVEDGRVKVLPDGDSVFTLLPSAFGMDAETVLRSEGNTWYVELEELDAEIAIRKDADCIVTACNKKRKSRNTVTFADAQLMRRADNLVPNWRDLKAEQRLAPIVDALRRLQAGNTPATVTKAATPIPPAKPAKVAPMPTRKPQPAPTPVPAPATPAPTGQGELSPHARALVDALAKIGGPAIKATMLQTAGIPASAWSDALSEAYRARKITRDRARTDNVWHVLAK